MPKSNEPLGIVLGAYFAEKPQHVAPPPSPVALKNWWARGGAR